MGQIAAILSLGLLTLPEQSKRTKLHMETPDLATTSVITKPDYRLTAVIVGLLLLALFSHLNRIPLRAEEPRRALVAQEMKLSGNYIAPTINGVYYYNKPPLYNWLLLMLYRLLGSSAEWVVRLPSVLSVLLLGWLHYWVMRRHTDEKTALLSALFYICSADILFYFSLLGEIDLVYTLLVYAQVIAMFHFYQSRHYGRMFAVSYFFAALGVLTKGLPSLLFQAFTGLALLAAGRKWRLLFSWQHLAGMAVLLLVTGGYFYLYNLQNNVSLYFAKLLSESTERTVMEKGWGKQVLFFLQFPVILLKLLSPFVILLPFTLHRNMWQAIKTQPALRFSGLFIAANIWVYWLSPGTKDRYLYMFLPFFFTLLAYAWIHFGNLLPRFKKATGYMPGIMAAILALASAATAVLPQTQPVPFILIKALLFTLLFTLIWFIWRQQKFDNLLLLVLCTILLRMEFNTTIIPLQIPVFTADAALPQLDKILEITNRQPVYLAGHAQNLHVKTFALGGKPLVETDIMQPPPLLFRISYYLTRATGHIVQYSPTTEPGKFYLADAAFAAEKKLPVLYSFTEPRTQITYSLCRIEPK